jgi:glycosyltransferase 2 family protein
MVLDEQKLQRQFSAKKILLPVALGLSVVGYMLYRNYEPDQMRTLVQASPLWLCITFLVLFIRDFGYIYRIRYVTDKALSWKQSFQVIMLWEFASCALPSVVGGSTVAAFILYKENIPLGKSIAQVMVTALLDNLYFVLAVPLVLLFAKGSAIPGLDVLSPAMRNSLEFAFLISYVLVTLYAGLMCYALFIKPKAVKRLLIRISLIRFMKRWRISLFNHANELLIASQHMRNKDAGYWLKASISTAFVWTSRYAIIGCLIAAFTHLSLEEHLLVFSRNLIYKVVLMMSVTPGAAGLAEISFPAFFGMFLGGFTTVIILLYRLLTYYLYLVIGAIVFPRWAAKVFSKNKKLASQQTV